MTPLADMIPTMSDPDLKALRLNALRLSDSTTASPTQVAAAAGIIPLIDAEAHRRAADKPAPVKKARPPAKKKVVPATGHQTALPNSKAA